VRSRKKKSSFTHGLHQLQHFSCDSPVRYLMYSEATAAFISLHSDNTCCFYKPDCDKYICLTHSAPLTFKGLTATKISGYIMGWGPGAVLTLLDSELKTLEDVQDAPDVCVCQAAEHSTEVVTAGVGNVCVWSVMLMRYDIYSVHSLYLHSNITAIAYCSQQDCLIVASKELSIRVWGPDWELRFAFVGHNGMVSSLLYCSELSMLVSAAVDCTIRCWNVEEGDVIECIHTEKRNPPLGIECTRQGGSFLSFSCQGVDLWTFRRLYTLHSELGEDRGPLRQILVPPLPAPYPTRALCVRGDRDIILVTAETGAVLTSFRGEQRILCADYCLHKEILLGLTETGTVLQANTLTNPITLLHEWKGRGQGPCLSAPGPACCLVLYSYVTDPKGALEEWRDLQEWRGCSKRDMNSLDDAKNMFLVILGQRGGCVSVLTLKNGTILCRIPAHNGQTVTTMEAYPERGEDKTVVVWLVNPCISECLTKQMSLYCGQPHVYLAVLGPRLALTFEEPASGTYSLMHFNFTDQTQTDHPPREEHLDHFTGLCVCPDLEVFVSSSLDGTVHIWNEENRLIRLDLLNAVPECIAYSGFGEVLLGIRGSLYKMNCAKFLPRYYQKMVFKANSFTNSFTLSCKMSPKCLFTLILY
uniref:Uncharacterized protein n=1 Tax=Sphaeramia orbicularis TaxID=375764 RepID=A0A673AVL2_9TELE